MSFASLKLHANLLFSLGWKKNGKYEILSFFYKKLVFLYHLLRDHDNKPLSLKKPHKTQENKFSSCHYNGLPLLMFLFYSQVSFKHFLSLIF